MKALTMDPTSIGLLMHALGLDLYVPVILALFALCSVLAAVLPHPTDGTFWVIPRKILDAVAMNFGHATNAVVDSTVPKVVAVLAAVESVEAPAKDAPATAAGAAP